MSLEIVIFIGCRKTPRSQLQGWTFLHVVVNLSPSVFKVRLYRILLDYI